jgi:type VI secretion system FHA domain protein
MFTLTISREGERDYTPPPFEQEQVTLGRRSDNDVPLLDQQVSGLHALIERRGSEHVLIDRRSTNGTLINGEPIAPEHPVALRDGDEVMIGPFVLRFEAAMPESDRTLVRAMPATRAEQLADELSTVFAQQLLHPAGARREALLRALQQKRDEADARDLSGVLREVAERFRTGVVDGSGLERDHPAAERGVDERSFLAGYRTMKRVAERTIGNGEFADASDIERFGELVEQFVDMTSQWMLRSLKIRREVKETLSVDMTRIRREEPNPIENAQTGQDVARMLLDWSDGAVGQDGAAALLTRMFKDLTLHQIGMLKGGHAVIKAILDTLSPQGIEQKAWDACSTIKKPTVSMAAKSPLWAEFQRAYRELTENKRAQDEIILTQMRNEYLRTYETTTDTKQKPDKK